MKLTVEISGVAIGPTSGTINVKDVFSGSVTYADRLRSFVIERWLRWFSWLTLDLQVLKQALRGRWMSKHHVQESYDRLASDYDDAWGARLKDVTERSLCVVEGLSEGDVLDLGCGSGTSTLWLSEHYPNRRIIAVDISQQMLKQAEMKVVGQNVEVHCQDLLSFLKSRASHSAALVNASWSIGYSDPAQVIAQTMRVLRPSGEFIFIVNYLDTLRPIFLAFQECMLRFPSEVKMAARPSFPRCWSDLERQVVRSGASVVAHHEGYHTMIHASDSEPLTVDLLLRTGVLAGFDAFLPLTTPGLVRDYFEELLARVRGPVEHHYVRARVKRV